MPAFVELVVVDQFGIRPLCPTPRSWIQLVRKLAHGNGDRHAFDIEKRELVVPVETGRGNRRVRQPRKRDVVENIVSCKSFEVSVKDACDELIAARVVVQQIGREADG